MSIRRLPKDAVDKIKSSSAITSLNQVICGLLTNSLDASATKVNISLDYVLGNCTVQDNGLGIEPSEFEPDGGLGKLHHTSKTPPSQSIHGSHGRFVASTAAVSLLTIASHHARHTTHGFLSIHNGQVLARHVPAPPDQRFESFSHGTSVTVRNLFGSMPVRVKQRGQLFSDRFRVDKEWEALIRDVTALLLAWPSEVSVALRETNTKKEQRLKSGNADIVSRASRLFTQAGLADSEDSDSWVPVSVASRLVRIKGAISTNPVATRRPQIMSLGIRPIPNEFGTNALYEEVNKLFQGSHFGVVEDDDKTGSMQAKPRKGIERWPMFYLEIHLLGSSDDLAMGDVIWNSQHSLQSIIDLLKVICYGFLKKHFLQPKHVQPIMGKPMAVRSRRIARPYTPQSAPERQPSPQTQSATATGTTLKRPYSPFNEWSRIKVGRAAVESKVSRQADVSDALSAKGSTRRLVGANGVLLRKPFDDIGDCEADAQNQSTDRTDAIAEDSSATDNTKISEGGQGCPSPAITTTEPKARKLESRSKTVPQEWLRRVIHSWKNPVFELTEPRIPTLHQDTAAGQSVIAGRDGPSSKFYSRENDVQFEAAAISLNGRLSRAALAEADIIGQVDRKFILLRLPLHAADAKQVTDPSSALIMLDQHAADERCRLEELMSQYFELHTLQAMSTPLERPIVFEISGREHELLDRFQRHFRTWGVSYKTSSKSGHEIEIKSLPPSIIERCRNEPKLVINVVRREIWRLEDGVVPPRPVHEAGKSWVSCFHSCPQGILELLHSRSCRSAIMFNDKLSRDECTMLVERLSRCAFPFQCAHGRPSLVPIVDIGLGGRIGDWKGSTLGADRWKSWIEK